MIYSQFKKQAVLWDAKFYHHGVFTDTDLSKAIIFASKHINLPHEDYPLRVPKTTEILIELADHIKDYGVRHFTRQIHHMLFAEDLAVPGIEGGAYRKHSVGASGGSDYLDPIYVHDFMESFYEDFWKLSSVMMYKVFESIHPFPDGNGRVGGILLFIHSFNTNNGNEIIIPAQ